MVGWCTGFAASDLLLYHHLAQTYGLMPHEVAQCQRDVPGEAFHPALLVFDQFCLMAYAQELERQRQAQAQTLGG